MVVQTFHYPISSNYFKDIGFLSIYIIFTKSLLYGTDMSVFYRRLVIIGEQASSNSLLFFCHPMYIMTYMRDGEDEWVLLTHVYQSYWYKVYIKNVHSMTKSQVSYELISWIHLLNSFKYVQSHLRWVQTCSNLFLYYDCKTKNLHLSQSGIGIHKYD